MYGNILELTVLIKWSIRASYQYTKKSLSGNVTFKLRKWSVRRDWQDLDSWPLHHLCIHSITFLCVISVRFQSKLCGWRCPRWNISARPQSTTNMSVCIDQFLYSILRFRWCFRYKEIWYHSTSRKYVNNR